MPKICVHAHFGLSNQEGETKDKTTNERTKGVHFLALLHPLPGPVVRDDPGDVEGRGVVLGPRVPVQEAEDVEPEGTAHLGHDAVRDVAVARQAYHAPVPQLAAHVLAAESTYRVDGVLPHWRRGRVRGGQHRASCGGGSCGGRRREVPAGAESSVIAAQVQSDGATCIGETKHRSDSSREYRQWGPLTCGVLLEFGRNLFVVVVV